MLQISRATTSKPAELSSRQTRDQRTPVLALLLALAFLLPASQLAAAPQILALQPADGELIGERQVTFSGRVEGAVRVAVDSEPATLAGDRFTAGPFELAEGETVFVIEIEDKNGDVSRRLHRVVADRRGPVIQLRGPAAKGLVNASPHRLRGLALDDHLESVTVNGRPARLDGARFEADVALTPGAQEIEIVARDRLGHETRRSLQLVFDDRGPAIDLRVGAEPLLDGAIFAAEVMPRVTAPDAERLDIRIDGAPLHGPVGAEGEHRLEVVAVDAAGNVSRLERRFTVDRTPPAIHLAPASRAAGTAVGPSARISGRVDGASLLTVDARPVQPAADGRFEIELGGHSGGEVAGEVAGERWIEVVAVDRAGNRASERLLLKIDADAPLITVSSPSGGAVVGSSPVTVSGTAVDADLLSVTVAGQAASLSGDAFSAAVSLVEGLNTIAIVATDAAANSSQQSIDVTLDTVAPQLSLSAGGAPLEQGAVFAGLVTPIITTTDNTATSVVASLDGAPWASGTTIDSLGQHQLSVTATDAAGNNTTLIRDFTVEGTPPVFHQLAPADGSVVAGAELSLTGRVAGAASLTVDGQAINLAGEDFVAGPYTLTEGERTFNLLATSPGGQTTAINLRVVRDSTPPALGVDAPADGAVQDAAEWLVSGTVMDPHFDRVDVNGAPAAISGNAATGATWSATITAVEGENTLLVRAEDVAGNHAEIARTVALDSRPPSLVILDPAAGSVVAETPWTVSGTVSDPHLDRVEIGGVTATLGTPGTPDAGTWSASVPLTTGPNALVATAFDTSGHSSSAGLDLILDPSAPRLEISAPAAGLHTSEASVDTAGSVTFDPASTDGATVTVNGVAAVVDAGSTWQAPGISLAEGENTLIVRAMDGAGRESVLTRTVVRDGAAPEVISAQPAAGSVIDPAASFQVTFSEPLAPPATGAWRLETAAGTPLGATAELTGTPDGTPDSHVLSVTPSAVLPASTALRLVLTIQLADLAGNNLPAETILDYATAAAGGPAAPTLEPTATPLCAGALTLRGTAAPDLRLRAEGGAAAVVGTAAADGSFELEVGLLAGRLHVFSVIAIDGEGRPSPPATVTVLHDCAGPQILAVELIGDQVVIRLDEAVDAATAAGAVTLSDAAGAIAGTVSASGAEITFSADASLPAIFRLQIAASLADIAGNVLGYPYSQVFGQGGHDSFISGTILDQATGRPLAGARVLVTATGGAAPGAPAPEQTTGEDGSFLLAVPAGTHDLLFERPGYTPAFRIATTTPGSGVQVFAPRLQPLGAQATLDAAGGRLEAPGGSALDVPPGALAAAAETTLTALDEQALPALLPYGWSPRGAAWTDLGELGAPAQLELPVAAADGTTLYIVELDAVGLQWRLIAEEQAAAGKVSVTVQRFGAYAALESDSGALAPPPPVLGEVLGSARAPLGTEVASATVRFDPQVVLPSQTSDVTVDYVLEAAAPSGLPLILSIQEELTLLDGSIRRQAPYRAHIILYHAADGSPRSRLRLQPSLTARTTPIQLGAEEVEVWRYLGEGVRGNVLGPDGGSVLGEAGDRLDVPAGALGEPTAIVIERRTVGELPLAAPAGGTVDGVLHLDLAGAELAQAATLSFARQPAPAAGETALLLHVLDVLGSPRYRAVAELVATSAGWQTAAIDDADLPWPGVRSGGFYLVLLPAQPLAFARGTVLDPGGQPLAGAVVQGPQADWLQLTGADGRYVLPLPVGPATIEITDPATGNSSTETLETAAAGERADVDLQVRIVGPQVLSMTPPDGSEVPAGIEPQISFSEAVDPASASAGIVLQRGGQPVAVDVEVQGSLVTVLPHATLAPGATYVLSVGAAVRDLQGYGLEAPATSSFTVSEVVLPGDVDASKIHLFEPAPSGLATVRGVAGAVPGNRLVWVENLDAFATTESVTSAADGSFELEIAASLEDQLLLHILVPGANELIVLLGPYMTADRQGAWIDHREVDFHTADGLSLHFEASTFTRPTLVSARRRDLASPAQDWPAPGVLVPAAAFDIDFGETRPARPIEVSVPAPAGAVPGWFPLARATDFLARPVWQLTDIAVLDGAELTSRRNAAPPPAALGAPALKSGTAGFGPEGGLKSEPEEGGQDPREFAYNLASSGAYAIFSCNQPLGWLVLNLTGNMVVFSDSFPSLMIAVDTAITEIAGFDEQVVPILLGQEYTLTGRDGVTGHVVAREVMEPQTEEFVVPPPGMFSDGSPPYPIAGHDVAFHLVSAVPDSRELDAGIRYTVSELRDAEGQLLEDQTLEVKFAIGSLPVQKIEDQVVPHQVKLFSIDDASEEIFEIGEEIDTEEVTVSRDVKLGQAYFVTIAAVIPQDEPLTIKFNEPLHPGLEGFELWLVEDTSEVQVDETATPAGSYATIEIEPASGWRGGETYLLRLTQDLIDPANNAWLGHLPPGGEPKLEVRFAVEENDVFRGLGVLAVRDVDRLGSLLFVAAGLEGLWVLDAGADPMGVIDVIGDPLGLANYFDDDLHFTFPEEDQVQAVRVDPHGRVVVAGGGVLGPGQLKILDPQKFAEAKLAGDLSLALRGSTLVSDQVGGMGTFGLPPGKPGQFELLSRDLADTWHLEDQDPPDDVAVLGNIPEPWEERIELTFEAPNGTPEHVVTLFNETQGTWRREQADADGLWSIRLEARRGDQLKVLRNVDSLAYVTVEGAGMAVVDLNHFDLELLDADDDGIPDAAPPTQSQVLRYPKITLPLMADVAEPGNVLCDPDVDFIAFQALELDLIDRDQPGGPWHLPVLVQNLGLAMLRIGANEPVNPELLAVHCGVATKLEPTVDDIGRMTGMAVIEDYPVHVIYDVPEEAPLDEEGKRLLEGDEERDYAVLTNALGWVLVIDITKREEPRLVARIELPSPPAAVTIDAERRQLLVSAMTEGIHVVDFDGPFGIAAIEEPFALEPIDSDLDEVDDRIKETILVEVPLGSSPGTLEPLNVNQPLHFWRELGLAWLGGLQNVVDPGDTGLGGMVMAPPKVRLVALDKYPLREAWQLAPFGVPTALDRRFPLRADQVDEAVPEDERFPTFPGLIRVEAKLPSRLADELGQIKVDLLGTGPEGLAIHGAGDPNLLEHLPLASFTGEQHALVLERQSELPWHDGSILFASEPIVVLADLRASYWYDMTSLEKDALDTQGGPLCPRCDLYEEEVYEEGVEVPEDEVFRELLSGHHVGVRWPAELAEKLQLIYGERLTEEAQIDVRSAFWDISPSVSQEPAQSPSFGNGQAAPGTNLQSLEFNTAAVDLAVPGIGFDLAFQRIYRSQTVGSGPLGPGWDHLYRMRLRQLPNRDVELYDGRGRRERFRWVEEEDEKFFESPPGVFMELVKFVDSYRLHDNTGKIIRFDGHGRLQSIIDPFNDGDEKGSELLFEYDAHSRLERALTSGRVFSFEYDELHRLVKVIDDTGREITFEYHPDLGQLVKVLTPPVRLEKDGVPQTLSATYTYEDPGLGLARQLNRRDNLEMLENALQDKVLELTWVDGEGEQGLWIETQKFGDLAKYGEVRLLPQISGDLVTTRVIDRLGRTHVWTHLAEGHPETYTDPLGEVTTWRYEAYEDRQHGLVTELELPSGYKTVYEYDAAENRLDEERIPPQTLANVSKISRQPGPGDEAISLGVGGCVTSTERNGSGSSIDWTFSEFHSFTQKPRYTRPPVDFVLDVELHDDRGYETRRETTVGGNEDEGELKDEHELEHDDSGRPEKLLYTRSDRTTPVRTDVAYFEQDLHRTRLPETVTVDPLGENLITSYTPNLRGYMEQIIEPGEIEHTFDYNALGWLLEECHDTDGEAGTDVCTRYVYDQAGQLKELHAPFGAMETEQVVKTFFEYGRQGELERMLQEEQPGDPTPFKTERRYNKKVQLEEHDVTGRSTVFYEYDERDLLDAQIEMKGDEDEIRTEYEYTVDGLVSEVKIGPEAHPKLQVWRTFYDGYRRPMWQLDPEGHVSLTRYDAGGRPQIYKSCDKDGELLSWREVKLDGADRPVEEKSIPFSRDIVTVSGEEIVEWNPDPFATVVSKYAYDSRSHLRKVTDPRGRATLFDYDDLDRLTETKVNTDEYVRVNEDFDGRGNPRKVEERLPSHGANPTVIRNTLEYDGLNRVTKVIDADQQELSFVYDRAGHRTELIQPGGRKTVSAFDGLGRLVLHRRPESIEIERRYLDDLVPRREEYVDELGQTTKYEFDGAGRLRKVVYPGPSPGVDGDIEEIGFDDFNQVDWIKQADGTVVKPKYFKNRLLQSREVTLAGNTVGPAVETFGYDGLGRVLSATVGDQQTHFAYDTLSRLVAETTGAHTVGFDHDKAGDVTHLTYPSALTSVRSYGALGQLETFTAPGAPTPDGSYTWLGGRVAERQVGGVLSTLTYDDIGRLENSSHVANGRLVLGESLNRDARGLVTAQIRADRNRSGWQFDYDDAGRLHWADWTGFDAGGQADGSEQWTTSRPGFFGYLYDEADNLTRVEADHACGDGLIELPLAEDDRRNRPASVDGVPLDWDDRGHLKQKGELHFVYDARDRLVAVNKEDAGGVQHPHVTFVYDALGRRIEKKVESGLTTRTVWDGWQPIEEYRVDPDGSETLISRRFYGAGLDEMFGFEYLLPGNTELTAYTPVYDAIGNVAAMLGPDGDPVERYDYSPYGERFIWRDDTAPTVQQVRLDQGEIFVELSEEPVTELLSSALNSGLKLENVTQGGTIPLALDWPVSSGLRARHRLRLTLDVPSESLPDPGDQLRLSIPASALEDLFGNRQTVEPVLSAFAWAPTAPDPVVSDDMSPPAVVHACVNGGKLRLVFSEPPDPDHLGQLQLDGDGSSWALLADGYTVEYTGTLTGGAQSLVLGNGPFDLEDKALGEDPTTLDIPDAQDRQLVNAAFPGERGTIPGWYAASSSIGNPFGLHGLPIDAETGLIYVRNRYYDPELRRFIQPDPLGYFDSPTLYQFALNDPVNKSDPTGLCVEAPWDALSLGLGAASFSYNVSQENYGEAIWDAVGIAVDTAALAIPCVPAGVGATRAALRSVGLASDALSTANYGLDVERSLGFVHRAQVGIWAGDVAQGFYQGRQEWQANNRIASVGYFGLSTVSAALGLRSSYAPRAEPGRYSFSQAPKKSKSPKELFTEGVDSEPYIRIRPRNLYYELRRSEIGKETIDLIREHEFKVILSYQRPLFEQEGYVTYGHQYGEIVTAYILRTKSKRRTAETIIHEVTHAMGIGGSQRDEIIAEIRALKHTKAPTFGDIRDIIKRIKRDYSHLPYR